MKRLLRVHAGSKEDRQISAVNICVDGNKDPELTFPAIRFQSDLITESLTSLGGGEIVLSVQYGRISFRQLIAIRSL